MSKHRIPNDKWMEFISEIATQLTELNFHEDTFIYGGWQTLRSTK